MSGFRTKGVVALLDRICDGVRQDQSRRQAEEDAPFTRVRRLRRCVVHPDALDPPLLLYHLHTVITAITTTALLVYHKR